MPVTSKARVPAKPSKRLTHERSRSNRRPVRQEQQPHRPFRFPASPPPLIRPSIPFGGTSVCELERRLLALRQPRQLALHRVRARVARTSENPSLSRPPAPARVTAQSRGAGACESLGNAGQQPRRERKDALGRRRWPARRRARAGLLGRTGREPLPYRRIGMYHERVVALAANPERLVATSSVRTSIMVACTAARPPCWRGTERCPRVEFDAPAGACIKLSSSSIGFIVCSCALPATVIDFGDPLAALGYWRVEESRSRGNLPCSRWTAVPANSPGNA